MKTIEHYKSLRDRLVSERVTELMKDNPDIALKDNYSIEIAYNIQEYMFGVSTKDIIGIKEVLDSRRMYSTDKFMEVLGRRFYCGMLEYWERMATERAERDVPSIAELMEQDQAEAEQDSDNSREDARMGL